MAAMNRGSAAGWNSQAVTIRAKELYPFRGTGHGRKEIRRLKRRNKEGEQFDLLPMPQHRHVGRNRKNSNLDVRR